MADARAHGGQWLVRLEDVDTPRTVPGATERILQQLAACGLVPDEPVLRQSTRTSLYQHALDELSHADLALPLVAAFTQGHCSSLGNNRVSSYSAPWNWFTLPVAASITRQAPREHGVRGACASNP
ncbi:glutamate--tRNA ligase family protein [Candidatus Aalborgicola defluviihabitans]|uniref:glutamate--tRNA ligase family protein n=1 Tax=Candidatus Aalborgicola defluviihabitans TaxID=3386187 RepID=UPI0039B84157